MTDELSSLLNLASLTTIVDVGANPIDGDPPYRQMLQVGQCQVIGFEPQTSALEELNRRKGPLETYLPYALGDGAEHTLRICSASGMTSLLMPDKQRLSLFKGFTQWGHVEQEIQIPTLRLDDVREIERIDYLKIDVQGAEAMIFLGGANKLHNAVAIQTEVSFVPLYEGQPCFGDVDLLLRGLGFIPHSFAAIKRWGLAEVVLAGDFRPAPNQLLEADLVYVRDFGYPERFADDQLKHLAMIGHHVYGSVDLALWCIRELIRRGSISAAAEAEYLTLAAKRLGLPG